MFKARIQLRDMACHYKKLTCPLPPTIFFSSSNGQSTNSGLAETTDPSDPSPWSSSYGIGVLTQAIILELLLFKIVYYNKNKNV